MSNQFSQSFIGKNVTWMLGHARSIASDAGARRTGRSVGEAFFSTYSRYFRSGQKPISRFRDACEDTVPVVSRAEALFVRSWLVACHVGSSARRKGQGMQKRVRVAIPSG